MADNALAGVRVLVTRPRIQGQRLVQAIEARGGSAILFPVIEVVGHDPADITHAASQLFEPDIVIFVSVNAVRFGHELAGDAAVAAIGPATTRSLEEHGLSVTIQSPDGYDSEHLLQTPELSQVDGKVVRIIRGNGGREILAKTLRQRGATVEYLEVYARQVPEYTADDVAGIERQLAMGDIDVITIMSVESLVNLLALLPQGSHEALRNTPLVTPAKRVLKELDKRLPGTPAILADGPQAPDMVDAIVTRESRISR